MQHIRLLAFQEHHVCGRGHELEVWVRPRGSWAREPMRRCPTCQALFVMTPTPAQAAPARPELAHDDLTCPGCGGPFAATQPYPPVPRCRECAAQIRAWTTDGPDLPASAASVIRCWAVSPAVIDLRDPADVPVVLSDSPARLATLV